MINPLWRSSDRPAGIGFRGLAAAFGVFFLFCLLPAQLAEAAVWYVNDTSPTGDSYTYAAGADTNTDTARTDPDCTIRTQIGHPRRICARTRAS